MIIKVTKCIECPFFDPGDDYYCLGCTHPQIVAKDLDLYNNRHEIAESTPPPADCPLRLETVLVTL